MTMREKQRPSRRSSMLEIARVVSRRSTCERGRVGCVITNLEMTRVLAMGYNGNYHGGPNTCDHPGRPGGCKCLHAEANALIKAPYRPGELTLFSTMGPCLACAKMILNARITTVVTDRGYRDSSGLELLCDEGVEVFTTK